MDLHYDPTVFPTLQAFHADNSYFRLLRGPAGSGKTYGAAWELLIRAMQQAPAKDGVRYSRALVVRNTYNLLKSATLQTFKNTIGHPDIFHIVESPLPYAECKMKLGDGTKLHFEVYFRSFDGDESAKNALGLEPTFVFIDEISEFPESLVLDIIRRTGRYPTGAKGAPTFYGVWAAMNGPSESHFLSPWEDGRKTELFSQLSEFISHEQYFKAFPQPAALIPKDPEWAVKPIVPGDWAPNPLAENVQNLKGGYGDYYAMLTASPAKIRAYVLGEYSPLSVGKRVFPSFTERHVIKKDEIRTSGRIPLYLGFDFGRTPVCLVATATAGGRLVIINEVKLEDAAVSTLVDDHLFPLIKQKYPLGIIQGAWGDPAGSVKAQSVETSPYDVLLESGIPIEDPGGGNRLDARIEAVRQMLVSLDELGLPSLQVVDECIDLIYALKTSYIYEKVAASGDAYKEVPTKTHDRWASDLADALQYLALGYYQVGRKGPKKSYKPLKTRWI